MAKSLFEKLVKELDTVDMEGGEVSFLSTGCPSMDWLLSNRLVGGGLPIGRITEFFGEPSTGKSLLLLNILAEIQKAGGIAILDDVENAFERTWAEKCGLATSQDKLIVLHSATVEEHYKAVKTVLENVGDDYPVVGIALDSVAQLTTSHEVETGMEKRDMTKAQEIRKLMRLTAKDIAKTNTIYMVANHVIANIGAYGNSKVTPGGSGIPFGATIRVELSLKERVKDNNKKVTGTIVNAYTKKNRIAPPFQNISLAISFEKGLIKSSGMFDLALAQGIIVSPVKGYYAFCDNLEDKKRRKSFTFQEILAKCSEIGINKEESSDISENDIDGDDSE